MQIFSKYLLVSLTTEIKNLDNFGWKIENEAQCKSRTGEKLLEYLSRNIQILELWQYQHIPQQFIYLWLLQFMPANFSFHKPQ